MGGGIQVEVTEVYRCRRVLLGFKSKMTFPRADLL